MTDAPQTPASTAPAIYLRAQFIKDLSFENPRAPASLFAMATLSEPFQLMIKSKITLLLIGSLCVATSSKPKLKNWLSAKLIRRAL